MAAILELGSPRNIEKVLDSLPWTYNEAAARPTCAARLAADIGIDLEGVLSAIKSLERYRLVHRAFIQATKAECPDQIPGSRKFMRQTKLVKIVWRREE